MCILYASEVTLMSETISELNNIYLRIKEIVEKRINDPRIYDSFVKDTYLYSFEKNTLTIATENQLSSLILSTKYLSYFEEAAKEFLGLEGLKVKFEIKEELKPQKKVEEVRPEFFSSSIVNVRETFDNFIVGPNNKEAQQAALLISASPTKMFNPLFIYSDSGLGKTHLLYAIANYVREKEPTKKVLYCFADDFVAEYIKYMRGEDKSDKLKKFIVSHDYLLIDDIQQFAGKEQTELFFFQIFNTMHAAGKQIVITADKHPEQLKGFEERLKSRFQSGLTVKMEKPDTTTCVGILKSKISASPINLDSFDEDVLEFIASKFSKNIRQVDEALNRLIFHTTRINPTSHITMDVALEALQDVINVKDAKTKLNEQRIISVVADYYNLTVSQITGKGRPGNVTLPRHICWYLIKTMLDTSYEKIGYLFGGKDHSTVMSGVKKVENELKTNTLLQNAIDDIKKVLKQ